MHRNAEPKQKMPYGEGLSMLVMVWVYRIVLLLTMMAGVCKFSTLPIRLQSIECVIVLGAYAALLLSNHHTYKATAIGQAHVSELLMCQLLSNLISVGLVYLGTSLYVHQLFNPVPLLVLLVVQGAIGLAWTIFETHRYFKHRRPPRTAVIYGQQSDLDHLYETPHFHEKYNVCKLIHNPEDDISALRKELEECEVVFTTGIHATQANGIAKLCLQMGIVGYFVPRLGHIIMAGAEYMTQFNAPVLRVQRAGGYSEYRAFKRLFDLAASVVGIIVLSPVMLATAVAIWLEDHGPVLYRQIRLTRNGKHFNILKFRSMSINAEKDGVARLAGQNDDRITKVGRFIRACRIDELPQLFNILKGEMSVVGPRPERPEIATQYEEVLPEFALRLQVKAGLTGLAQVYGRYNTEPYNKLQMDLMYINEISFLKDMQLLFATIKILFVKESTQGVAQGQETALGDDGRLNKSA